MNSKLSSEERPKNYLLVEGDDDKNVFIGLLNYYKITDSDPKLRGKFKSNNEDFDIKNCEGIDNLLDVLKLRLKDQGDTLRRFGVVVDADVDINSNWKRIRDILQKAKYRKVPKTPEVGGTLIKEQELPTIGVWIMPNNMLPGMVEDFISFLGPQNDILWPHADEVLQKVIATKCNFPQTYTSKARLHTWLAWQEVPGRPMGQAITKKYVDATSPHAQQLILWIRKLYELEQI